MKGAEGIELLPPLKVCVAKFIHLKLKPHLNMNIVVNETEQNLNGR